MSSGLEEGKEVLEEALEEGKEALGAEVDEKTEALFKQKIAEQKRVLKKLSKNQLIRIVVDMSVRAFYHQSYISTLEESLNEANKKQTETISSNPDPSSES